MPYILFKKETPIDTKNYISPNQTNILDQIKDQFAHCVKEDGT